MSSQIYSPSCPPPPFQSPLSLLSSSGEISNNNFLLAVIMRIFQSLVPATIGVSATAASSPETARPFFSKPVDSSDEEARLKVYLVRAQRSATVSTAGCTHGYKESLAPGGVPRPDSEIDSSVGVDLPSGDLIAEHSLCIDPAKIADAPPCIGCTVMTDWRKNKVYCVFPATESPVKSGIAWVTYSFAPNELNAAYRRVDGALSAIMDEIVENHYTQSSVEVNAMMEPAANTTKLSWLGKITRRRGAGTEGSLSEEQRITQLLDELRDRDVALRGDMAKQSAELEDEKKTLDEQIAPRICQAVRDHIWPRVLDRADSAREHAVRVEEEMRREAAEARDAEIERVRLVKIETDRIRQVALAKVGERLSGVVTDLLDKGVLIPSLGTRDETTVRVNALNRQFLASSGCTMSVVGGGESLAQVASLLKGACLGISTPREYEKDLPRWAHVEVGLNDAAEPPSHVINCFLSDDSGKRDHYFGTYTVTTSRAPFGLIPSSITNPEATARSLCTNLYILSEGIGRW